MARQRLLQTLQHLGTAPTREVVVVDLVGGDREHLQQRGFFNREVHQWHGQRRAVPTGRRRHDSAEAFAVHDDRVGVGLLVQDEVGPDGHAEPPCRQLQVTTTLHVRPFLARRRPATRTRRGVHRTVEVAPGHAL
ncbi:MAG TPA: hypothetical protein PLQ87_01420 [Phycisphaerae bacterium]|nr:hypothetical protein [Phycisphaerae bacterium]